jgi:hypothetical protein
VLGWSSGGGFRRGKSGTRWTAPSMPTEWVHMEGASECASASVGLYSRPGVHCRLGQVGGLPGTGVPLMPIMAQEIRVAAGCRLSASVVHLRSREGMAIAMRTHSGVTICSTGMLITHAGPHVTHLSKAGLLGCD